MQSLCISSQILIQEEYIIGIVFRKTVLVIMALSHYFTHNRTIIFIFVRYSCCKPEFYHIRPIMIEIKCRPPSQCSRKSQMGDK